MSDQNHEKRLDDLLDSALSEYSAVEPRPGLEGRILARIQEPAEQPRWWGAWAMAGAVGVVIAVIVLSVLFLRPVPKPKPQQVQVHKEPPAMSQAQPDHPVATNPPPVRRGNRPHRAETQQELAQSDRPSVFPTPTGLTEQEKLMLAYLAQTPKEEIIAQMRPPNREEEEEFWKDPQPAVTKPQR